MTAEVTASRFPAFDRLRGLIMILMAIDHASFFIAKRHAYEGWALPPEPVTITRWITHLCAPGFLMLMGAGMVWLGKSRQKMGWTHSRIRWFFIKRGLVLLVIQHIVENPAWGIGLLTMDPSTPLAQMPSPGGGSQFLLHFGVISALAVAMIFWSLLIELPSVVILGISGVAMALSMWMTPPMSDFSTLFPIWKLLLFVPSHTNAVDMLYPWVPWLVPAGIGIVLGRLVYKQPERTAVVAFGIVIPLLFTGWAYFVWNGHRGPFTKYPPSLAFFAITLGIDCWLAGALAKWPRLPLQPLEVFGRSPLFFYLLHLYVLAIVGLFFRTGSTLPVMYAVWAGAIIAMYPLVAAYGRFKASKPIESMWRLF